MSVVMRNRYRWNLVRKDVQKRLETEIVQLIFFATLNTEHNEAQLGRIDTGVVETVSDSLRRLSAVNPVTLEPREAFLLNRDNNPVAFQ
jgi:hypothetical protein